MWAFFPFIFLFSILSYNLSLILLLESSGYKFNENIKPTKIDIVGNSHGPIGHPTGIGVEIFFIIKSLNHQNIRLSIEKGIWATQIMNEPILEEAFHVRNLLFWYKIILLKLFYTEGSIQN